jgi:hypothetical protein
VEALQAVVDDLAQLLGRGVAIDDRHLHLLVHSAHGEDADELRRISILTRRVPKDVEEWAFAHGLATAEEPVRLPPARDKGMEARLVIPVRCQGLLLGFLTVLDPAFTLTDAEVGACRHAGIAAGGILYRERLMHEAEAARERQLVDELLDDAPAVRQRAAEQLTASDALTGERMAVVLTRWSPDCGAAPEEPDVPVERALDKARRLLPPGALIKGIRGRQAVVILDVDAFESTHTGCPSAAAWILELIQAEAGGSVAQLCAGFGDVVGSASEVRVSYQQAQWALQTAARTPAIPNPAGWPDLGVYRVLSSFPLDEETLERIPTGCRTLFEHPEILYTVERYLDLACNVKVTATELSLHRASLYYRLKRAEEITGLTFKSGEDRLTMHLCLRLLRLAGAEPTGNGRAGSS